MCGSPCLHLVSRKRAVPKTASKKFREDDSILVLSSYLRYGEFTTLKSSYKSRRQLFSKLFRVIHD